jgi:hypothetical protein
VRNFVVIVAMVIDTFIQTTHQAQPNPVDLVLVVILGILCLQDGGTVAFLLMGAPLMAALLLMGAPFCTIVRQALILDFVSRHILFIVLM